MSSVRDFLDALKDDLLNKRLLPILLVLGIALAGAVAYAVLGGAPTTPASTAASTAGAVAPVAGVVVSPAPADPGRSVAETTNRTSKQHGGHARDPFTPLHAAKAAPSTSATSASAKSGGASTTSSPAGSKTPPSGTGGSTSGVLPEVTPPATPKVYVHYHVTAQLGVVPATAEGAPPPPAQLKTYKDMALDEPLPGKANPRLVFLGVMLKTGKEAMFALVGEAILHGSATCKPSPTQCQAIELRVGQTETLEFVEAALSPVTYELKLLSITRRVSSAASAARVHAALRAEAKDARELLRRAPSLSKLHYSARRGGLVFVGHSAFAVHAHAVGRDEH
jgi:hypothetical protein